MKSKRNVILIIAGLVVVVGIYWFGFRQTNKVVPGLEVDQVEESLVGGKDIASDGVSYVSDSGELIEVFFDKENETAILNGLGYDHLLFVLRESASGARYVNEKENLVLWNKGEEISLMRDEETIFVGRIRSELLETEWVWIETVMSDGEVITPVQSEAFTLAFGEEGRVVGTTDCNGFRGSYTLSENGGLTFGEMASTKMFCEGSQENLFRDRLKQVSSYMIDESGRLVLMLLFDSGSVILEPR